MMRSILESTITDGQAALVSDATVVANFTINSPGIYGAAGGPGYDPSGSISAFAGQSTSQIIVSRPVSITLCSRICSPISVSASSAIRYMWYQTALIPRPLAMPVFPA